MSWLSSYYWWHIFLMEFVVGWIGQPLFFLFFLGTQFPEIRSSLTFSNSCDIIWTVLSVSWVNPEIWNISFLSIWRRIPGFYLFHSCSEHLNWKLILITNHIVIITDVQRGTAVLVALVLSFKRVDWDSSWVGNIR